MRVVVGARSVTVAALLASALACGTLLDIAPDPAGNVDRDSGGPGGDGGYAYSEGGYGDSSFPTGDADGGGGDDAGPPLKRPIAFVTSTTSNAYFQGAGGANAICSATATLARLPGQYRAYLQLLGGFNAEDRLVDAGTFYRVDGTPIFDSFPPLSAKVPFLTESGQVLPSDAGAWTGIATETCSDWTDVVASCGYGAPSGSGTQWRRVGSQTGTAKLHVYCFGD